MGKLLIEVCFTFISLIAMFINTYLNIGIKH